MSCSLKDQILWHYLWGWGSLQLPENPMNSSARRSSNKKDKWQSEQQWEAFVTETRSSKKQVYFLRLLAFSPRRIHNHICKWDYRIQVELRIFDLSHLGTSIEEINSVRLFPRREGINAWNPHDSLFSRGEGVDAWHSQIREIGEYIQDIRYPVYDRD